MTHESGSLAADEVRGMFDRIAPVYDAMNRVMTVGLDRTWRRLAAQAVVGRETTCSTRAVARATSRSPPSVRGSRHRSRLLGAHARTCAREVGLGGVGRGRRARPAVRRRHVRRRHGRLRRAQRRRTRTWPRRTAAGAPTGRAVGHSRDHAAARPVAPLLRRLVRPGRAASRPRAARRPGLHVPAGQRAALPRRGRPRVGHGGDGLRGCPLPPAGRQHRRAPHGTAV